MISTGLHMQCFVYRSRRKQRMYLFLPERDNFAAVPKALLTLFGEAEFSFEFELSADRPLKQADSREVIRNLEQNGFFLQLPPADDNNPQTIQ